ncbi:hypothetical protein [Streptomyces sp. QHH-9511]|uniref:hypothetical protein n=1 Tax=Streptomyces sp. QHH-9511 TaxID=2684468 RepID=UPI00131E817E|nr:hypothetical protein [Streptomyces sp. QHH-9511]
MPSKKDTQLLANLRAASTRLTEVGAPELAAAVDEVLTPGGWGRLRHATEAGTAAPNVPIHMPLVLRAAIQNASASVPKDVAEGLEAFIAGTFSPAAGAHRARRNTGLETGNLNVRVDADLRARFLDAVEARESELGYRPALSHVAKAWLIEKYDIAPVEKLAEA